MNDIKTQRQNRIALASAQQKSASDPASSVWVEASAGTGKTKVLSDRVLRLLLEGINPARILCLTYTKAAASEMNNRIINRLSAWATIDDTKLEEQLVNLLNPALTSQDIQENKIKARRLFALLLDTPGGIKIQTIHSFCQEILKRFPLEAKVSPYFTVIDDRETSDVLEQIKLDILRNPNSPETTSALSYLTSHCSEYTFPKILSSITSNCSMLKNYFANFSDFSELKKHLNNSLNIAENEDETTIIQSFWDKIALNDIQTIISALNAGTAVSANTAKTLADAVEQHNFDAYISCLLTKDKTPKKNFLVKSSLAAFPSGEQLYHSECERLQNCLQTICNLNLRNSTQAVLSLAYDILNRYQEYKDLRAKMDYNDLIGKTSELLHSPQVADWVLYKLDGGIDHILIDEAQDTSPEQWNIIQALSSEFFSGYGSKSQNPTVFVVGDRKQSIYSFQGADVKTFEKLHRWFNDMAADFKTVNMEVSFRSTSAILDMVNTVFSSSSAACGVVLPDKSIHHIPSRIGEAGKVELWEITYPLEENNSTDVWLPPVERLTAPSASSLLAQRIAEMIKQKVTSSQTKADGSPLKYNDFLILVQRRNSFVEELVRSCKNIGVPIAGVDKIVLSEQIVIDDLLSAAKFALLPGDDLNLACLLKSPLFNLTDDDLLDLCYNRQEQTVWQRLQNSSSYSQVVRILQQLIAMSGTTRPFEFFSYILNVLQGRRKLVARLSSECEDAIDEFINLCLSFEQSHIATLQSFIEWMQRDDVEVKRSLEQNENDVVRLMTVHGSKGLQSPIVILPDTVRFKNIKQEAGWLKYRQDLFYPLGKDYYNQTCIDIQKQEQLASLEEYNRLLYVALTRAGEQLYICGYSNKNTPNENSWYEVCRQSLAKLTSADSNHSLIYETNSEIITPKTSSTKTKKEDSAISDWLYIPVAPEPPLAKPLTPSHQNDDNLCTISPLSAVDNSHLYIRGNLIHKLLQFLPSQKTSLQEQAARNFLQNQAADLSPDEKEKIITEVMSLIHNPTFAPLFSENSLAEVSLMGQADDQIISGQIDRLIVLPNKVMIIDYKTNRPAAQTLSDVPEAYRKQMQAYKKLIAHIYPDKKVETYILWTNTAHIMKID